MDGHRKLAAHAERIIDVGYVQLADQPFHRAATMQRVLPSMVGLQSYRTVYGMVARYVRDERLRQVLTFERFAPGTRDRVVRKPVSAPVVAGARAGLPRGNVMHLEMSVSQMFMLRPFLGMAGYRTHLRGLYLTGASTHPGGGIMGASGRNAARVVLRDLERRRV